MTDKEQVAQEATPEVVQTEAEQAPAPEAVESTEGQTNNQPAEVTEPVEPEAEEEVSASKARRERRKAQKARMLEAVEKAEAEKQRVERDLAELRQSQDTTPPRQEDFADYEDYTAAKAAHASMKLFDQREIKRLERAAEETSRQSETLKRARLEEAQQNWAAQSSEARQRYADFDAVVTAPDVRITESMTHAIAMSDSGADIAYYLGMNKEQAELIAAMPPEQQSGALAMLERIIPTQLPKPRTKSAAPDPVSPVNATATGTPDPTNMTPDEYRAWRQGGGKF